MGKVRWIDCWRENKIKCPYCGFVNEDEDLSNDYEEYVDMECVECGKTFGVSTEIEVKYTTTRKDGDAYLDEWDDDDEE